MGWGSDGQTRHWDLLTCGGGAPTPRSPVLWPLSPSGEQPGVSLGSCRGVTEGASRRVSQLSRGGSEELGTAGSPQQNTFYFGSRQNLSFLKSALVPFFSAKSKSKKLLCKKYFLLADSFAEVGPTCEWNCPGAVGATQRLEEADQPAPLHVPSHPSSTRFFLSLRPALPCICKFVRG